MAIYTVNISSAGSSDVVSLTDGSTYATLEVSAGKGPKGDGWTGVSYDGNTGQFTFTSNDGLQYTSPSITSDLDTAVASAEAAQAAAEAAFDQFQDQYLGASATDPSTDLDGDPLDIGDAYWNSAENELRYWSGTAWVAPEEIATNAATTATTQASNAASSAAASASSASAAANSASAAATSEANADTSEANALTYSSNAATSAAQAASSAAGIAGYDLDVIAETKGVTAVDVFVYDTSRDTDGGKWRKRTQHTSWYNETLNTSTRGSRKEFPAVAVIVAESDKVTIYDGDNPDLPMWMVFQGNTTHLNGKLLQAASDRPVRSVMMLNGLFTYAVDSDWVSYGQISFISEDVKLDYLNGQRFTVATRNDPLTQNIGGDFSKNFAEGNDVAMTVLPNAPIDAATGLPVPTIAVATAFGVSVIRDDGTVVDLTYTASVSNEAGGVWFPSSGGIAWQSRYASSGYVYTLVENEIPSSDKSTASDALYANFGQKNFVGNDLVTLGISQPRAFIDSVIGSPNGFTRIDEKPTAPSEGMVAYTASDYNTGWMNGDTKGAFLSDTDTTDLVGSGELISNGGFDDDYGLTGWTQYNGGTFTIISGELNVTTDTATPNSGVYQTFSTVIGRAYKVSGNITNVTGTPRLLVGTGIGSGNLLNVSNTVNGTTVNVDEDFIATSTTTYVSLQTSPVSTKSKFDNISVKLADADRSVNNNGLVVSSKTYDPWHDDLNLAFDNESFTVDRQASDFMSAITHDASSNATVTGGYGPELVTNGGFDTDSDWTKGTGWSIANGVASSDGTLSVSNFDAAASLVADTAYEVTLELKTLEQGFLRVLLGSNGEPSDISTIGVHKFVGVCEGNNRIYLQGRDTFIGSVDNISVREIPKVQWRPHNLLPYSEDFTVSAWTKSSTTVTANAAVAPDGTTTADEISHTSTNAYITRSVTVSENTPHAVSLFVKRVDHDIFRLSYGASGATSTWFNINTGSVLTDGSGAASITDVGNSWWRINIPFNQGASSSCTFAVFLSDADTSTGETSGTSAYIWGASVYRSDLGGMAPVPTDLQTASSTTYVRTAGREVTGTELVTNGTFNSDTSGWTAIHGVISHQSGKLRVEEDGVNAFGPRAYQIINTEVGKVYRAEADVSNFNIASNAVLVASTNTNTGGFPTTNFSSGTGRLEFVATTTQTYLLVTVNSITTGAYADFDNITLKEIDVDPSTARYLPRLGHHVYNGSAWVNEGLLHESETRTNLITRSETLDAAPWSNGWGGGTTLTANAATAPDGTTTADKLQQIDGGGDGVNLSLSGFSVDSYYTVSCFIKNVDSTKSQLNLFNNSSNEAVNVLWNGSSVSSITTSGANVSNANYEDVGNGWIRVYATVQVKSTSVNLVLIPENTSSSSGNGAYFWGAQLEAGSTPSSYIPTSGSTATRASESLTIPAANLPYSSTAMTIQMDGRMTYADEGVFGTVRPLEWLVSNSNKLAWELSTNSTDQGRFVFLQDSSSVRDVVTTNTDDYLPDVLVPFNLSSRYTSTALNASIDGVALTANTTPTSLPDLSSADLNIGTPYNGTIRNFRMWGNDIKDDGIEIVTQPSITPSLGLSFDGSEASHVEFDWSEK